MITLYQFDSCPFCSKVRAFLHYIDQPFELIEVSPFGMKELDFTDHKKVPVLKDADKVITESSDIIEYINETYAKFSVNTQTKKWTTWVDDTLVHFLPPLIHPNFTTSYKNFFTIIKKGQYSWPKTHFIRFFGAIAMPKVAKKMKTKYNIESTHDEYLEAIDQWTKDGLKNQRFFDGDNPSFVDYSVFGVLNSCHDIGPVHIAITHNSEFKRWYNDCLNSITK